MSDSKVIRNNTRVIERTQKSIKAEYSFYYTRNDEYHVKNDHREYEDGMKKKSDSYAYWWIYEKGDRARLLVEEHYDKLSSVDPCFVNVYNKKTKKIEKYMLKNVLPMMFVHGKNSELHPNRLGQTRFWDDLYIATEIYNFLHTHWCVLEEGSSVC